MSNVFSVASVDNKSCQSQNLILQKIRVAFRCVLRQWEVLGRMQSCNNPLEVQEASESSLLVSLDLDLSQKQHQDTSLDWSVHGTSETQPAEPVPHPHACPAAPGGSSEREPILAHVLHPAVVLAAPPSCRHGKEDSCPPGAGGNSLLWSYSRRCLTLCRCVILCLVLYVKILAVTRM